MGNSSDEKGKQFESIVEKIYIQIANNERIKAKIERNVPVVGNDGASHEIFHHEYRLQFLLTDFPE